MSSWHGNSGPLTYLQHGHQGTPAAKVAEAAAPQRELTDMYLSNTENFPFPRRNDFSTDQPVLPFSPQNREVTCDPSGFFPKMFNTPQINLQMKNRAKIYTGMRLNLNLRRKMTQLILLSTIYRKENSSMILKKKDADYQYIIKLNQNNALQ